MIRVPWRVVERWPGRQRFPGLIRATDPRHGDGPLDDRETALAVLHGWSSDLSPPAALRALVDEGETAVAEAALGWTAVDEPQADALRERIAAARAAAATRAEEGWAELRATAHQAGVGLSLDDGQLTELARESWPEARQALAAESARLGDELQRRRSHLELRLAEAPSGRDAWWAECVRTALAMDDLPSAELLLERTGGDDPAGPTVVPHPQPWPWPGTPPGTALSWFLDPPTVAVPAAFGREWRDRVGPDGRALLQAHRDLREGGDEAAEAFVAALDRLLGVDDDPAPVSPTDDGRSHVGRLRGVFNDRDLARFAYEHPRGLQVWLAGADGAGVPRDLPGREPVIAVGPSLVAPASPMRGRTAVLDEVGLLRLVTVQRRTPVALVRLLAPQWSAEAVLPDQPEEFAHVLGRDPTERLHTLGWIADLLGLSGPDGVVAMAFETGLDPRVLRVLLRAWAGEGRLGGALTKEDIRDWKGPNWLAAVEQELLAPIANDRVAQLVVWVLLHEGLVGRNVPLDELGVLVGAVVDEVGAPAARDRDGAPPAVTAPDLAAAAEHLGAAHLASIDAASPGDSVDSADPAARAEPVVRLLPTGALLALAPRASQRARDVAVAIEAQAMRAERGLAEARQRDVVTLHLHELKKLRLQHEDLLAQGASPAAVAAVKDRIVDLSERFVGGDDAAAGPGGPTDVGAVARRLRQQLADTSTSVEMSVHVASRATVTASLDEVDRVLSELVGNAVEAVEEHGGGHVEVTVTEQTAGDRHYVLVDVHDTGPGVVQSPPDDVFLHGVTTKGEGRGDGLYLVRRLLLRLEGDISVVQAQGQDVQYPGAHIRVRFPAAPGNGANEADRAGPAAP